MGSNAKWEAQDRGDTGTTFAEAVRRHWPATAFGTAWTILLALTAPRLILWFSPVILGFILAIPLSVWTSKPSLGLRARLLGLFLIPEEVNPPHILRDLHEALRRAEQQPWAHAVDGLDCVLADSELCELHLAALADGQPGPVDELKRHHVEGLVLKFRHQGSAAISSKEKRELLLFPEAIAALRAQNQHCGCVDEPVGPLQG
jgi:membrane glycosyltransferase